MKVTIKDEGFPTHSYKLRLGHYLQVTGGGFSAVLRRTGFLTFEITFIGRKEEDEN